MLRTLIGLLLAGLLLAALLLAAVRQLRRSPFSAVQTLFHLVAVTLARVLWRAEVDPPRLPLPQGQGAVIVSNHRSSVDPFFVQLAADRKIHWMVAREYCEHPALRWFLSRCEVIPVGRGGIDTAATRAALRYVQQGGVVGMLPEGRINTSDEFMLPVRPGAVLIALKAKVPIVPCYIEGAPYDGTSWSPLLMPARVRVRLGQPIDLSPWYDQPDADTMRQLTLQTVRAIAQLAGRPDFEPQLAGRRWKPE